jgi:DNA repair exonuclease SbcCD nuclease subunit
MKVAIIGDPHIGASYHMGHILKGNYNSRLFDFRDTLRFCLDKAGEYECKLVILTGDIFRTRRPEPDEQEVFWSLLKYGHDKYSFKFLIVAGNHDFATYRRLTISSIASRLNSDYISATDHIMQYDDFDNETSIIAIPFHNKVTEKLLSTQEVLDKLTADLNTLSPRKKSIAIWHAISEGTYLANYSGAEIDMLNEPIIPLDLSKKYSISIFGHVHRFSRILNDDDHHVINIGSMDVNDFSDAERDKYMAIIDTEHMTPTLIKLPVIKAKTLTLNIVGDVIKGLKEKVKIDDVTGTILRLRINTDEKSSQTFSDQEVRAVMEGLNVYKYMGSSVKTVGQSKVQDASFDLTNIANVGSTLGCIRTFLTENKYQMMEETLSYAKDVIARVEGENM